MLEHIPDSAPASLVVIGSPPIEDFDAHASPDLLSLVLVEPDPRRAAQLSEHFEIRNGVKVINVAVDGAAGSAELREFNFPGLRSIRQPATSLRRLLPGIRVGRKCTVDVVNVEQLLAHIGDLPPPVHLHINLPGSEYDILKGWHEKEGLDRLALIRVRCSAEPMFEGACASYVLTEWMSTQSFIATVDRTDPDWPNIEFHVNPLVQRLQTAEHKDAEQSAELVRLRSRVEVLDEEAADLRAKLAARDERIAELEANVQAAHDNARSDRKALAAAQSDLAVGTRMQMIAQSDLRDLQMRFVMTERARATQENLLRKLTSRLQEASQQLQLLTAPEAKNRHGEV